jgi:hypothetical protein
MLRDILGQATGSGQIGATQPSPNIADRPQCSLGFFLVRFFEFRTDRHPANAMEDDGRLCYRRRYRPVARQPQMVDTAMSYLGFRCAFRASNS